MTSAAVMFKKLEAGKRVPFLPGSTHPFWTMCVVTRQDSEVANKDISKFAQWWARAQLQNGHEHTERIHAARCGTMVL